MLTIEQVQAEAFATATEKGWHKRPLCTEAGIDHDRVLAKLALVHSELTEAQDCLDDRDLVMSIGENDKPEGSVSEICAALSRRQVLTPSCFSFAVSISAAGRSHKSTIGPLPS
jgi:hypothetical protein